jgi:hypothetical protein
VIGRWLPHLYIGAALLATTRLPAQSRPPTERPPVRGAASTPALITIALLDLPLVEALEALSQAARMNLVWQAASLGERSATRVSCRHADAPPEEVLRCITRSAGLDYVRLSSGTYVVVARTESAPVFAGLAGVVIDAATGTPLPSARIQLAELPASVLSQDDGGFSFPRLRPGRYALSVRAVGYRPSQSSFELQPNDVHMIRLPLERTDVSAGPIVVNGVRPGAASRVLGAAELAPRAIDGLVTGPAVFLPGAPVPLGVSRRDGTGDLHLQGGDLGEHPWRLDGIPLYDAGSLAGLLGVVAPAVVERLTVRRSGFRAADGSFATGVIDLEQAVVPADGGNAPATEFSVNPITASGRLSAPIRMAGALGHVMVAGRTGMWQWTAPSALVRSLRHWSAPDPVLLARLSGFAAFPGTAQLDRTRYATSVGDEQVSLHDLHAATRLRWGVSQQLDVSAFRTANGVSYDGTAADTGAGVGSLQSSDAYSWRTTGGQMTHRWLIGPRVRQRVQLRAASHALEHSGRMHMLTMPAAAVTAREDNGIAEVAVAADWRVTATPRVDLVLGTELAHTAAHLDLANRVLRPIGYKTSVVRGALFSDATIAVGGGRYLDAGLRVTQLQSGRTYAEPRVALRGERVSGARPWAWRVAGGGYHQFVNQFDAASTMPVAFVPNARFWLPSDGVTPVARAWHLAAEGVLRPRTGWEIRGESYIRWQPSIPMFNYGVMFDSTGISAPVRDPATLLAQSSGKAYGLGVRVIHEGALAGVGVRSELAYDGGSASRRFPARFGGTMQPPPWLEPHRVLLATEARPVKGLVLAARTRGVWGRPWVLRQAYYDLFGAAPMNRGLPIGMPGAETRPVLIDVDLGLSYTGQLGRTQVEIGASLTNALNRPNVLDYGLRRQTVGAGYEMVPRYLPGRQPAFSVRVRP